MQLAQERVHLHRPGLLWVVGGLFDHAEQLAEVMHVAEGVLEVGVVAVRLEPVVDGDPGEVREHAGVVKAVDPAVLLCSE